MLFFQLVLVLGYAYSHWVTEKLTPKRQLILHAVLLLCAMVCLPVKPTDWWRPPDALYPTPRILMMLLASVGLPFFLLSTTGPLIQAWQSRTHPGKSPFRLFALSNAASLAALISYPFLFEPYFTTQTQSWMWSGLFLLFAVSAIVSGCQFALGKNTFEEDESRVRNEATKAAPATNSGWLNKLLWLMLPMLASVQLLATTNLMTQELGSLPFLWILPLSLYLISFIICFDHNKWYFRPLFFPFFLLSASFSLVVLSGGIEVPLFVQVGGYSCVCFGAAMCCHGELARIKPGAEQLTMFYLFVSIGGALGGIAVAILAPILFNDYFEYQAGLILAIVCCLVAYRMQTRKQETSKSRIASVGRSVLYLLGLAAVVACSTSWFLTWQKNNEEGILEKSRSAYGTLKVKDYTEHLILSNGATSHGIQFKDEEQRLARSSYYSPGSGLGRAISWLRKQSESSEPAAESDVDGSLDFAAIGLGVGTVCAWCEPEDTMRIFEINPDVERVARKYFTYLSDCKVEPQVVLGDARLQLEKEIGTEDQKYDLLIADAFSSDSVPMHLLTLEAFEIYQDRLKENGILAVHVSNRFLSLDKVVESASKKMGLHAINIWHKPSKKDSDLYYSSSWVLVVKDKRMVEYLDGKDVDFDLDRESDLVPWTDDFASILPALRWGSTSEWINDVLEDIGWRSEADEED